MKKFLLSVTAVALFFAACKKDDAKTTTPGSDNPVADTPKLIMEVRAVDPTEYMVDSVIFKYNEKNQLISSLMGYGGEYVLLEATYTDGKMTKITASENGEARRDYRAFKYNSAGKLVQVVSYNGGDEIEYDSLVYDANEKMVANYRRYEGKAVRRKDAFVWEGNNIIAQYAITIENGVEKDSMDSKHYIYDTNKNFQSLASGVMFMFNDEEFAYGFSANNVVKYERMEESFVVKYTSAYTYDKDLYPVTYHLSSYNDEGGVDEVDKYNIKYNK